MKGILLIIGIFLSHTVAALDLVKYPIELSSYEGITVVIVPTLDKKQALLKITGINHSIDDVVFLTTYKQHGNKKAYKYTFDGSERALVSVDDNYGCCSYELYIPDSRKSIYLEKTENTDPIITKNLLAQYEQQLNKGLQAKLAAFNREKHVTSQQQSILDVDKEVLVKCELPIQSSIDWKKVSDADLKKYSVGSFCAQVGHEIAKMCEQNNQFKTQVSQFNAVHCDFTDTLKLRKKDKVLNFKIAPTEPNQPQFINSYLRNL
ncbi:hypothetical protein MUS1_11345 [Marinomonas ushuaiensis DSM 15871]|uniref:Uncharacterized protein n=1 Tax=Marinomonas ushuaiensis DSM 15871 TaxID=1122207 RepID=X7E5S6_9GAMM|nr:hypothetical protein [Marinomonas ushuaiensis]ETX11379.1 hypothetical protein MUS1_11345 [Marinomonas ushuaiensis DSM 15871]